MVVDCTAFEVNNTGNCRERLKEEQKLVIVIHSSFVGLELLAVDLDWRHFDFGLDLGLDSDSNSNCMVVKDHL